MHAVAEKKKATVIQLITIFRKKNENQDMEHPENSAEYAGLQVNAGVEQPAIVNPYLKKNRFKRREYTVDELVKGILEGNITMLSQAGTLIESQAPEHQE